MADDQQFTFSIPYPQEFPRIISIEGEIPSKGEMGYDQIDKFLCHLVELGRDNNEDPVKLLIDSPGGDGHATMLILNHMSDAPFPIYTITRGASSAAALIFIAGTMGYRYIFENSYLMFHAGKITTSRLEHILRRLSKKFCSELTPGEKLLNQYDRRIARLLLERTEGKILNFLGDWSNVYAEEKRIQGVLTLLNRDEWFDAKEAIEYGLADHIIDEEMFKKLFLI